MEAYNLTALNSITKTEEMDPILNLIGYDSDIKKRNELLYQLMEIPQSFGLGELSLEEEYEITKALFCSKNAQKNVNN